MNTCSSLLTRGSSIATSVLLLILLLPAAVLAEGGLPASQRSVPAYDPGAGDRGGLLALLPGWYVVAARPAPQAQGDALTVCPPSAGSCDYSSVQGAVDAASPGETIKVAQGVYTGTGSAVVSITKSLTLRGGYTVTNWTTPDPDAYPTILDGEGARRVVYIGDVTAMVAGFHAYNGSTSGWGAGIRVGSGDSVIQNNRVYSNTTSGRGGGIAIAGGSPTLTDNDIYSNTAGGTGVRGGGIYVYGSSPTIRGNRVCSNTVGGTILGGGGIFVEGGNAALNDNAIWNNTTSVNGGGIYVYQSDAAIRGNDVNGNTAGEKGGGVFVYNASPTLEGNQVYSNSVETAGQGSTDWGGGGIFVSGGSPTIRGNAIYGNHLSSQYNCGGGIYLYTVGTAIVERNDVHDNSTAYRGGGWHLHHPAHSHHPQQPHLP